MKYKSTQRQLNRQLNSRRGFSGPMFRPGRRVHRGSTILLVLSILSVLVLLAIMMTFTSRMETTAAANFGRGVQNRSAAITGVDTITFTLASSIPPGPMSPLDLSMNPSFMEARMADIEGRSSLPLSAQQRAQLTVQEIRVRESKDRSRNEALKSGSEVDFAEAPLKFKNGVIGNPGLIPFVITPTAEVGMLDASSLININAADQEVLARFFEHANNSLGTSLNAESLAEAIASVRLGPDGAPGQKDIDDDFDADRAVELKEDSGKDRFEARARLDLNSSYYDAISLENQREMEQDLEDVREPLGRYTNDEVESRKNARYQLASGVDEADEYVSDLRLQPYGDDIRFGSIADLLNFPSITSAGLDRDNLKLLSNYLTVFSASRQEFLKDGEMVDMIDLNRATPEEIYEGLRVLYGDSKNDVMLKQFAVNIVDFRDTDSVPTVYPGTSGTGEIIGLERTLFITEVYANSRTPVENGDDGQYVELYNPWPEAIRLNGWRLVGAGSNVLLNGTIPSNGFLIITDDLDGTAVENEDEEDLPGTGSFYDIFGILPDGNRRQAMSAPSLSLPDEGTGNVVRLVNADGDTVDSFTFNVLDEDEDSFYSVQRVNSAVRESLRSRATPFSLMSRGGGVDPSVISRLAQSPADGPFTSPADVLNVFQGFSDVRGNARNVWSFPVVSVPDNDENDLATESDQLDARVLDLFTVFSRGLSREQREQAASAKSVKGRDLMPELRDRIEALRESIDIPANKEVALALLDEKSAGLYSVNELIAQDRQVSFGRINLNTADAVVLASLPGITEAQAESLVERRMEMIQRARSGERTDAILFPTISSLLADEDLFPSNLTDSQRIQALRTLLPHVALNSRSFRLIAQPRVEGEQNQDVQIVNRLQALVATDRNIGEIITQYELY